MGAVGEAGHLLASAAGVAAGGCLEWLRIRYERRDDIHESFLAIGCSLICLELLQAGGSF